MYQNEIHVKRFGLIKERVPWQNMPNRTIKTNVPDTAIPDNRIRTSKYTFLTFVPLNLFEQFSKMANVYFLVIAVLQTIEIISITNGVPVILGPLAIVVSISMAKDFVEDFKRHRSDNEENNRKARKLTARGWVDTTWESILVGDVIKVTQDEYFCADMLVLASSENKGLCYVETKNLDGETNLKNKQVPKELSSLKNRSEAELFEMQLSVQYEKPNPFLYKFNGSLDIDDSRLPLDQNSFILRGCSLRNSKWCVGVVAYNGHDTKIMLNSVKARPKRSRLELLMNHFIILIFGIQMVFCLFAAVYANVWLKENLETLPYLEISKNGTDNSFAINFFVKWGNWVLIFTNFVPISLLVTLEMVKFFQGIAITFDQGTISGTGISATVQSSNLNEELGQVSYVFSDKTGTLTQNVMDFKCFTVGSRSYGDHESVRFSGEDHEQLEKVSNVDFNDRRVLEDLSRKAHDQSDRLREFMMCLAYCHTIITAEDEVEVQYNASSPDELALANLARFCGWKFMGINEENFMCVYVRGEQVEYKYRLLQVLEFNSTRKRMSVLLQDDQGRYVLYCKGADSIIAKRLSNRVDRTTLDITWEHLKNYAQVGLRTLLLARRIIPNEEFMIWHQRYLEASSRIEGRDEAMEELQDEIEVNLELLGGTAIEDKLQDNVGQTIQSLKDAGIQVWVLTGDKIETAINIGFSCQLLTEHQDQILIDGHLDEDVQRQIEQASEKVLRKDSIPQDYALILSGDSLIIITKSEALKSRITQIAQQCKAVVACRVSPKQKQEIVALVRTANPTVTTLAIGDGANDVNMITAAHVGIGIRGVEGQQAARASDYAIGEFQILGRLLLYHGRESYRKNSRLVLYNFFKNMMLVLPQFWYAFQNGFSGVSLYDSYMYQCYNLFFTSLPIVLFAIFDEEFTPSTLMKNPIYYKQGLTDSLFNYKVYLFWIGFGALQALVIGVFTYPILEAVSISRSGHMGSFFATGTTILGYAVYNGNLKVLLFSNTHTIASLTINVLSIATFLLTYVILSASSFFITTDVYNTFSWSYGMATYYLATFALIGITTLFDLCLTRWDWFLSYQNAAPNQGQLIELSMAVSKPSAPYEVNSSQSNDRTF